MIPSTTNSIEGKKVVKYLGLVSGDAILGANIFRDFFCVDPRYRRRPICSL